MKIKLGEKKKKENNPWAICTASVGREDKEKYEKCVMSVKGEDDAHEGLSKERIEEIIQEETVKAINRRQARIDE
tara:strand:+ start:1100 stop:1324 length:225 start_codon:yes stop_codon:yes gene_type:complete